MSCGGALRRTGERHSTDQRAVFGESRKHLGASCSCGLDIDVETDSNTQLIQLHCSDMDEVTNND